MGSTYRRAKITQTVADRAKAESVRYVLTDTEIPGFWMVVAPSGRKSFVLRYRVGGGRGATIREPKIGEWPAMKVEKARKIAGDWSAEVRKGGDPGGARQTYRKAPTMEELLARYLTDHARPTKKPASLAEDERLIRHYLSPAFCMRKVAEVSRADIDKFHKQLSHKPYRANRSLALLSKAFNLAEVWGWRHDASNPCRHVAKFAEKQRKRFLSQKELAALGESLRVAERDGAITLGAVEGRKEAVRIPVSRYAVAAIRLLVLTGARKSEILGLQWAWIDADYGRANLPDSKTGEKILVFPPSAMAELRKLPRIDGNPYVIVGAKSGAPLVNLKAPWFAIREAARLRDVRIHDLRHSFASVGAAGGTSLQIIGTLLGHSQVSTTARYAHLADDPVRAAAADIGGRISSAMGDVLETGTVLGTVNEIGR